MKSNLTRLAPMGLIIALISALITIGLFIIQREFSLAIQVSLVMVVVGIGLFIILDPDRVRAALTGRQARYGSNAIILGVAFIGILVAINYLVYMNPTRWDFTETGKFTLMPETIETIDRLPGKVSIFGFYTPEYSTDQADALLDQYKLHSDGKIEYRFIDPREDPLTAERYNVTQPGTIVLVLDDHQEQINLVDELEITGALVRLISPGDRKVYFITGHGEYDPDGMGEVSYSRVKSTLEAKNYTIEKLNLISVGEIPPDAEVLIIAGPRIPLSQEEVDLLGAYVEKGGSMIVMEEPLPMTDFGDSPDPLAEYLTTRWGITLGQDMVVDPNSSLSAYWPFNGLYGDHIITNGMQTLTTMYPTARSVTPDGSVVTSARMQDLVLTAVESWAESDLQTLTESAGSEGPPPIQPDEGDDLLGPVTLAVTLEDFEKQTRLVVFGDSDFASDEAFYFTPGNLNVMVNSVDWASAQETLIDLTPKEDIPRILIPLERISMNLIFLASVILLPGLVLIAGIVVWVQRWRRG